MSESACGSVGGIERPEGLRELRRSRETERDLSKAGDRRGEVITLIEEVGSA